MAKNEKERPTLMLKAVYDGAQLSSELDKLRDMQRVLDKSGLDREAARLNKPIGELLGKIRGKVEESQEQRRRIIREMLLCFAAGDIATSCADNVEKIFSELAFGRDANGGKAIAQLFHLQAEDWNKCVTMVDVMGQNDQISMLYSDMAEDIVAEVLPAMYRIIDRYMSSKEGQRLI